MVACLLYVFHARMIQWSPELIRDPTFWFLFTLSLYWLWRRNRGAAGVLCTWRAGPGVLVLDPRGRHFPVVASAALVGLALHAVSPPDEAAWWRACLWRSAIPALFVLLNVTWLHHYPHWEFSRITPFEIARGWLQAMAGQSPNVPMIEAPLRMSGRELTWELLHTAAQGLDVLFALLMFAGIWLGRRIWLRRDHQALFYTSLLIVAGMWIHLWYAQISSNRYILPVVLMGSGFAALALLRLSAYCGRILQWLGWGKDRQALIAAGTAAGGVHSGHERGIVVQFPVPRQRAATGKLDPRPLRTRTQLAGLRRGDHGHRLLCPRRLPRLSALCQRFRDPRHGPAAPTGRGAVAGDEPHAADPIRPLPAPD